MRILFFILFSSLQLLYSIGLDTDGDSKIDELDIDDDNDGITDSYDPFPLVYDVSENVPSSLSGYVEIFFSDYYPSYGVWYGSGENSSINIFYDGGNEFRFEDNYTWDSESLTSSGYNGGGTFRTNFKNKTNDLFFKFTYVSESSELYADDSGKGFFYDGRIDLDNNGMADGEQITNGLPFPAADSIINLANVYSSTESNLIPIQVLDYASNVINSPDVYVVNDIAEDTTWASDTTYFLDGVISVMPDVTLKIEPGTIIRGLHSGETTNGDLSILFVLPGAKLIAKGTSDNPIIFTNKDDNLFDVNPYNPGDRDQYENNETSAEKSIDDQNIKRWGGIYILGNAFVDEIGTHPYYYLDPNFPGEYLRQDGPLEPMGLIKEIISLLGESPYPSERIYNTNDDSGDLEFISIRYTGDTKVYTPDRGDRNLVMQPNGLTLYGVGNGTDISNIEVYNTGDDAFMFHGGSVQPSKLAGIIFGDECFEVNYGWSGQINKIFGYGTEHSSDFLEVESYPNGSPTMNASQITISFASYINNSTNRRSINTRDGAILELLNSYISSSYANQLYRSYDSSLLFFNETNAYLTSFPTMEDLPNTFTNAYINDFEKTKSLRATHGAFANTDIWTQWMIGHKFLLNNCSEYVALSLPQNSALGDSDLDGIPDVDDLYTGFNDRDFEFYIESNTPSNYKTLNEYNSVVAERDAKLSLEEVAELRPGSTMIEVSGSLATIQLQMEESSDLQTWQDKGDPATMTIPADTDTKFFRFKMAE